MKSNKLLLFVILFIFSLIGCNQYSTQPTPEPTSTPTYIQDYIKIPTWIIEPKDIEIWLKQSNARYISDKFLTEYSNYYFTPAEMVMTEIPDVNNLERTIKKQPFHGDCDDWAIFTAYLLDYLGYESYYVAISNGLVGHAIAYAEKDDDVAIFDLWHYKEGYISLEDYIARKYPNHTIRKKIPINEFLEQLFAEGHIKYDNNFLEEEEG